MKQQQRLTGIIEMNSQSKNYASYRLFLNGKLMTSHRFRADFTKGRLTSFLTHLVPIIVFWWNLTGSIPQNCIHHYKSIPGHIYNRILLKEVDQWTVQIVQISQTLPLHQKQCKQKVVVPKVNICSVFLLCHCNQSSTEQWIIKQKIHAKCKTPLVCYNTTVVLVTKMPHSHYITIYLLIV